MVLVSGACVMGISLFFWFTSDYCVDTDEICGSHTQQQHYR